MADDEITDPLGREMLGLPPLDQQAAPAAEPPKPIEDPFKRDRGGLFVKGGPSGPGRPKGTRNKLATTFFDNLYAAWQEQGESVIRRAFFHDPVKSLGIVAQLMPSKIEISDTTLQDADDDKLATILDRLERIRDQRARSAKPVGGGTGVPALTLEGRAVETSVDEPSRVLSPIPKAT